MAKALAVIHERYAEELTIDQLASAAAVSRAGLGRRFIALLGEPPIRYCARWRLRVAAHRLSQGDETAASVAYAVGFNSEAAFNRAFRREYGEPPATWRRRMDSAGRLAAAAGEEVHRCKAADGAALAFAIAGSGFPLVKSANWMTHLAHDWSSPVYGHWIAEGARANRLIRADMRGFGMSDWDPPEMTFDSLVSDLARVIDAAGVEQVDLLGISHAAAVAIAYAARNPTRVRKLVLVNSFAQGWMVRADPEEIAWRKSLWELNRREWSKRRTALGEMFVTLYFPSAGPELIEWHNERLELLSNQHNIERMLGIAATIDVRSELGKVRAETLVVHSRLDGNATLAVGREAADGISGARFVELDSANHVLLADEPAWPEFQRHFRQFLSA